MTTAGGSQVASVELKDSLRYKTMGDVSISKNNGMLTISERSQSHASSQLSDAQL